MPLNYQKRVYGLDVFRALAILQVVISHGGIVSKDLFSFIPNFPQVSGVELFFVLSGFLIGGIIIKIINQNDFFSFSILFTFWKRRWFRTLPNYYLILTVNILLAYFGFVNDDLSQYSHSFWVFLQNFSKGYYGFFWESWSLSIEEWFYLFIPITAFVLLFFIRKRRAILLTILLWIFLPLAYRIYLSNIEYDPFWVGINISKVVLTRLDSIGFGFLAAYLKYYHFKAMDKRKNALFVMGVAILYTTIFLRGGSNDFFFRTFFFSTYSLGAMLLLFKADSIQRFKYPILGKAITHISLISYSMYLLHFGVIAAVIDANFSLESKLEQGVFYILYWVFTIGLSTLLYRFFEKPMTTLRDKY